MTDDPWAKFSATPPGAGAGASDDPWSKFSATPPGAASAKTATPADTDYSGPIGGLEAAGRTFLESAGLGAGDLILSKLKGTSLASEQAKTAAAEASLPFYIRYPLEGAGYATGAGALLSGAGEAGLGAIGATGLAARLAASPLASMATEGALAGGASAAFHSEDPSISDIGAGVVTGGALGGAAGSVGKLLGKLYNRAGTVDPAAAIAQTEAPKTAAYDALHQIPITQGSVDGAVGRAEKTFNQSEWDGMSAGMKAKVDQLVNADRSPTTGKSLTAGDIDSYQRQLQEAVSSSTDKIIASRINDNLDGVMQYHGASDLQDVAQAAYKKYAMAQKLADWQRINEAGGSVGQAPLVEAERYYQGDPASYDVLSGLTKAQGGGIDPTFQVGHLGGEVGSTLGGMAGGWLGSAAGHMAGYLGAKALAKPLVKGWRGGNLQAAYQAAYPQLTGVPLTGGRTLDPRAGDLIKNLMMGGAY